MGAGRKRSTVWLATLSTVVGVATGMFTLRDQVLDRGGSEAEASMPEYQRSIDPICDGLNTTESRRPREVRRLRRSLASATTAVAQRDAIMVSVRRTLADSSRQLAKFKGLDVPKKVAERHDDTVAAWVRNVDRLRKYESRLDGAEDRSDVLRAIKRFARARHVMGRDGDTRDAGLENLGGGRCLDEQAVTSPVALPALAGEQPGGGDGSSALSDAGSGSQPGPDAAAPSPDLMPDTSPPSARPSSPDGPAEGAQPNEAAAEGSGP